MTGPVATPASALVSKSTVGVVSIVAGAATGMTVGATEGSSGLYDG